MVKRRKNKMTDEIVSSVVFVFSSIVLFVNNLTGFFDIYDINVGINIISWLGIILSLLWWMYIFGKKNKMW